MNAYNNPYAWQNPNWMYQPTQTQAVMQQPQQNMMPVIQTTIIQPAEPILDYVQNFQIGNGQSQMFLSKDESKIYIKSATANGSSIRVYVEQDLPKPPEYVTVDQLKTVLEQFGLTKQEDKA